MGFRRIRDNVNWKFFLLKGIALVPAVVSVILAYQGKDGVFVFVSATCILSYIAEKFK